MSEEIKEIKSALDQTSTELKGALTTMQDEIKSKGAASKETNERVLKAEKALETVNKSAEDLETRLTSLEVKSKRALEGELMPETKSIGTQFVESEQYLQMKASGGKNSGAVDIVKDITNGGASAGPLTTQYRNPTIFKNPNRRLFMRDLVNRIPVTDSAVEIMRENVFTNSAAMQTAELADKAKSDITYTQETYGVKTVAHYMIASRQILSDVPRLRSEIDGRLMYGLDLVFDNQILFGDGTGQNFTGIMVDTSVTDAGASVAMTGTVWLDFIRSAITSLQLDNYEGTAIVLSPQDWELMEVTTGSDGHYIWATVPNGAEARMWRIPVVVSNAMTQGNFLIGDWAMGATIYDRQQKQVLTSDSHDGLFVKNGIAILAEERAAFAIERPKAFVKGVLTPAA